MRRTIPTVLVVCVVLLSVPAIAQEGNVAFKTIGAEATGIKTIMQKWHDAELARQGGKFGSHGWWPWGLTAFDYDSDGDIDLLPTHHGTPRGLVLKSRFHESGKLTFVDVTKQLGIDGRDLPISDGKPWIWDFDGDGWLDIAGWSDEHKAPSLFNRDGEAFVAIPKFTFNPVSHGGEVRDLNGDGYLDVRANHRGTIYEFFYDPKARTFIKHKRGPAKHEDIPKHVRDFFAELKKKKNNRYFTVHYETTHDLNGDGRADLVAGGSGAYGGDILGRYYLADAGGTLTDQTKALGLPEEGAPILVRDLTGDGAVDVIVAASKESGLYVNDGKGNFAVTRNLLRTFLRKKGPYLLRAWPVDFDNDGDMDLVVSNPRYGAEEIHENLGDGKFRRVLKASGWDSDPIAICDINNDGLMDVVIGGPGGHKSVEITIYLNISVNTGNWCNLSPRMGRPNWAAVGATVEVYKAGTLDTGKPFLVEKAHPDATPVHIGLGKATTFDLCVTYPDRKIVALRNVTVSKRLIVTPDGKLTH